MQRPESLRTWAMEPFHFCWCGEFRNWRALSLRCSRKGEGTPRKRDEESGEPRSSESSCLSSFLPNGLCGQKSGCFGFMIQDFSNTWNVNFQMLKLVLEKAEEPEIKLPTSTGSSKKQESSRETSISALLTTPKPLTVWITTNCGKFWKIWEHKTTWPVSWEICMQVRKQQLDLDMEQQTGSR